MLDDTASRLHSLLEHEWGVRADALEILHGGMNSRTTRVTTSRSRLIAKWVSAAHREDLVRGLHAAGVMSDHGIRSGPAVRTASGALTVQFLGGELALLEEVGGIPLSTSSVDQGLWGRALGAIHAVQPRSPDASFYAWLPGKAHDPVHPLWVRRAVALVYREYERLPPLTWVTLHTDPAPEAFFRDTLGDVGVIDWTGSVPGPALYDVASAVMYAGGESQARDLLRAYEDAHVVPGAEIQAHLSSFRRLRAAVQAEYFSRRLHEDDLTGIDDATGNVKGLLDARRMLESLGVSVD